MKFFEAICIAAIILIIVWLASDIVSRNIETKDVDAAIVKELLSQNEKLQEKLQERQGISEIGMIFMMISGIAAGLIYVSIRARHKQQMEMIRTRKYIDPVSIDATGFQHGELIEYETKNYNDWRG